MPWATQEYRVRRVGKNRFRIVNPKGEYVENAKGREIELQSHEQALKRVREFGGVGWTTSLT